MAVIKRHGSWILDAHYVTCSTCLPEYDTTPYVVVEKCFSAGKGDMVFL